MNFDAILKVWSTGYQMTPRKRLNAAISISLAFTTLQFLVFMR